MFMNNQFKKNVSKIFQTLIIFYIYSLNFGAIAKTELTSSNIEYL